MHILHLPRLGQTMQRGVINRWYLAEGESFDVGDMLYELETEKMNTDVEAKLPGTLTRLVAGTGVEVPIGALLAVVADPGETLSEQDISDAVAREQDGLPDVGDLAAEHPAAEHPAGQGTAPGPARRPDATPAPANAPAPGRVRAMPRARVLAAERGVDLARITGTGPEGTITVADVEHAAASGGAGDPPAVTAAVRERRPVTGIAKAMAENVTRSWREVPQFVQQARVDASALQRRRAQAAAAGTPVSLTTLLIAAVARAVSAVPEANASFQGEQVVLYSDVNVSVAVASSQGLTVPVLRCVQNLDLSGIASGLADIADRAKAGRLGPDDFAGSTITVSNLGMFGVETGFPLVNAPQAVIVFAGAVTDRPAVDDGQVVVRPELGLAIGYDHRVLDGATAARFTAALRSALQETAE